MYKVVFCDLDGTLLNNHSQISEGNNEAIKKAKEKGVHFLPCTGRTPFALQGLIDGTAVTMDNYISSNGAMVMCDGQLIHKQLLDKELGKKIILYNLEHKVFTKFYTDNAIVGFDCFTIPDTYRGSKPELMPIEKAMEIYDSVDVYKFTVEDSNAKLLKDMEKVYRELVNDNLQFTYTNEYFLEVIAKNQTKGNAIDMYCKKLGISPSETIGIGDNENDTTMLLACGLPTCVNNATDAIKSICKYVAANANDQDGVKEILEKYVL